MKKKKKRLRTRGNSSKYVLDKGIPIYPKPHKRLTTEFKVNFPGFCFPNKLFPGKTEYGRKDWCNGPGSTGYELRNQNQERWHITMKKLMRMTNLIPWVDLSVGPLNGASE